MSFFYDCLKEFGEINEPVITWVPGKGASVIGKIKVESLSEEFIQIESDDVKIIFCGSKLVIKTMSKGEVVVLGEIEKIETGEEK